jgi:hypothetical protein
MECRMSLEHRPYSNRCAVLALSALASIGLVVSADAQVQDQWKPVEKTLSDYVSDGFVIETILLDRVTPVSVQATVYYLRKDNVLTRCSETTTRRSGKITALTVGCAELGRPSVN